MDFVILANKFATWFKLFQIEEIKTVNKCMWRFFSWRFERSFQGFTIFLKRFFRKSNHARQRPCSTEYVKKNHCRKDSIGWVIHIHRTPLNLPSLSQTLENYVVLRKIFRINGHKKPFGQKTHTERDETEIGKSIQARQRYITSISWCEPLRWKAIEMLILAISEMYTFHFYVSISPSPFH